MTAAAGKGDRRILVFARAPVPGRCKTRLIPALGPLGAARLHQQLIAETVRTALGAGATVELWCTPDARHGFFKACRRVFRVRLRRQPAGDLGRKMARALESALSESRTALLVGTDCPSLGLADYRQAFAALDSTAACVVQPASDGGYVLIGARVPPRSALAGIAWSSGSECRQTLAKLRRRGLRCEALAVKADVDTPADYRKARRMGLLQGRPIPSSGAPATA